MQRMQILRYVLNPQGVDQEDGDAMNQAYADGFTATVQMPSSARVLPNVALTSNGLVIYAVVDPDLPEDIEREFYVVGNGRDLPEEMDAEQAQLGYLGTAKPIPGAPTFHVFELVKVAA